jgi:hypothetical protein
MTAVPGGTPPLKTRESGEGARSESWQGARSEGWQGTRLRAAVDRLHAAQLAALAAREKPVAPAPPAPAAPAPSQEHPAAPRDAHEARNEVLARMDEIGSLLTRLARLGRAEGADAEAVAIRRRLVKLAVAAATTLAELVGLAFEIESPADGACCQAGSPPTDQVWPRAAKAAQ